MLKHVIDIFNINLLNSITDSDSEEDDNSKPLFGYGTFLFSQKKTTPLMKASHTTPMNNLSNQLTPLLSP